MWCLVDWDGWVGLWLGEMGGGRLPCVHCTTATLFFVTSRQASIKVSTRAPLGSTGIFASHACHL